MREEVLRFDRHLTERRLRHLAYLNECTGKPLDVVIVRVDERRLSAHCRTDNLTIRFQGGSHFMGIAENLLKKPAILPGSPYAGRGRSRSPVVGIQYEVTYTNLFPNVLMLPDGDIE